MIMIITDRVLTYIAKFSSWSRTSPWPPVQHQAQLIPRRSLRIFLFDNHEGDDRDDNNINNDKGRRQKEKKRDYVGKIPKLGGGGVWPKPTFWCLFTKLFLACQNGSQPILHATCR